MCCIHATFALFYCLLFNLNLNSYEFEFKLNVFESFQKWKSLPFSPSPFQPNRPISSFSFSLFLPRPKLLVGPAFFPSPAHLRAPARSASPFSPLSLPTGPTCRVFLPPHARLHRCRWVSPAPLSAGGPPFKLGPLAGGHGIHSEPASQPPSTLPRDRTELGWNPSPGPARPRTSWPARQGAVRPYK